MSEIQDSSSPTLIRWGANHHKLVLPGSCLRETGRANLIHRLSM